MRWINMKKFIGIIDLMVMIFLVATCSGIINSEVYVKPANEKNDTSENVSENEEPQELETVKVAYMPNYASLNTVVAGIETGGFEEEGIEVELVEFADGPTIIAAMESGSIDVGYIGPGAHVLSIQGTADIFAFAHLGNADEVIGNTDKGVNEISDLKGKKIAVATGTASETIRH